MNQEARKEVEKGLKREFGDTILPLQFSDYSGKDAFKTNPFEKGDLRQNILDCLYFNKEYNSKNVHSGLETYSGSNRSVIDIWRHIKNYKPEVTIYEVMDTIYHLVYERDRISVFICGDIGRRVFILDEADSYIADTDCYDVFNLEFYQWKNI